MDSWYKSKKRTINLDTIGQMKDAIRTVLREGKSLAVVSLYNDKTFFYIKTNSKISLHHFLFQNGFEELDDDATESELTCLT